MVSNSHVAGQCLRWFPHAAGTLPTDDPCLLWFQVRTDCGTPATYVPALPTYQPTNQPTNQPTKHKTRTNQAREGKARKQGGRQGKAREDKGRQGKTRENKGKCSLSPTQRKLFIGFCFGHNPSCRLLHALTPASGILTPTSALCRIGQKQQGTGLPTSPVASRQPNRPPRQNTSGWSLSKTLSKPQPATKKAGTAGNRF